MSIIDLVQFIFRYAAARKKKIEKKNESFSAQTSARPKHADTFIHSFICTHVNLNWTAWRLFRIFCPLLLRQKIGYKHDCEKRTNEMNRWWEWKMFFTIVDGRAGLCIIGPPDFVLEYSSWNCFSRRFNGLPYCVYSLPCEHKPTFISPPTTNHWSTDHWSLIQTQHSSIHIKIKWFSNEPLRMKTNFSNFWHELKIVPKS